MFENGRKCDVCLDREYLTHKYWEIYISGLSGKIKYNLKFCDFRMDTTKRVDLPALSYIIIIIIIMVFFIN